MFGVYVHFPYCRKRCPYCDFAVHARQKIPHDRYAGAVLEELALRAPMFEGRQARSLYLGGGTPGLWRADCVARVVQAVTARFGAPQEITVEANPDDLPIDHLSRLREAGVNRLSIGVQSLEKRHLHTLGRLHGAEEAVRAVEDARAVGFDNLSLDLMFALPGQTMGELERDLSGLLAMAPEHLSIYNLTVEERTPFGAMKRDGLLAFPEDGVAAEMYEIVLSRAERAGYAHYEVSSFARRRAERSEASHCRSGVLTQVASGLPEVEDRRALHNTLYWTGGEYLGLGSSAASHVRLPDGRGLRFSNERSVDKYFALSDNRTEPTAFREELSPQALEGEAVWLGLRLRDGVDRRSHAARFGADPVDRHAGEVGRLAEEGLVEVTAERLRLTHKGLFFADEVGARFLGG
jgi:oxygen-independent coproporphyrinogen-3 oxidase